MRMTYPKSIALSFVVLAMAGCATVPTGPSVMVLPAAGKPFDQFRLEDATCRQWAQQQIGMSPQQAANQATLTNAVIGTVLGAALGVAIGAASGGAGYGAAIGASSGALLGTASGASAGQASAWDAQRRYDIAYQQCMYAYGNLIPGVRQVRPVMSTPPPPPPPNASYSVPESSKPSMPPISPGYGSTPPDYAQPPVTPQAQP